MHKLQFLRLVMFSSHWLIATVVTGSGTLHHHYTHRAHSYWCQLGLFWDMGAKGMWLADQDSDLF